jgi:hypothetical protein
VIHSRLTPKQEMFLRHYFQSWNAADAARKAHYGGPANVVGCKLLGAPAVRSAVQQKLALEGLNAEFVRAQLAMMAHASLLFAGIDSCGGTACYQRRMREVTKGPHRYSPGCIVGVRILPISGDPNPGTSPPAW